MLTWNVAISHDYKFVLTLLPSFTFTKIASNVVEVQSSASTRLLHFPFAVKFFVNKDVNN